MSAEGTDVSGGVLVNSPATARAALDDHRNVLPKYKGWLLEEIREDLAATQSSVVVIFQNIQGDFNAATGIRNALWFNSRGCYLFGRRRWDRRGAVGAHNYIDVDTVPSFEDSVAELRAEGYRIVAAEIASGAVPLPAYQWAEKTAIVFGEEQAGLSDDVLSLVDDVVYIPDRGSVRSLNVGVSSGIMLYDYHAKMGYFDGLTTLP